MPRILPHATPVIGRATLLAAALVSLACDGAAAAEPLSFNKDVRPILVENCFSCHGADSAGRKADLRLDVRDDAVEFGAITPGDPDSSPMLDRIFSDDPDEIMPPPHAKKTLTAEQKEILSRWIAAGAEYEPHWSFIPPTRPEPPAVKNAGWVRNPIDRFLLARLEAEGLAPAAEADRRTLARRASLDLTGLPPEPAVVEAFVNDAAPDAYERLVDTLLANLAWGEHRGRHWLDYARYADTHGIHFDNYREMWTYRQWVIDAFNRNMPFDRFTILQLAGDLVQHDDATAAPHQVLEDRIASGFNRCNMTTNEGGVIDEEYLVLYARDRTETTAAVWMGLTAGCAVCHDHKFDPLTQREFYELAAFFNNTTQKALDGNVRDTPPILPVPAAPDRDRWAAIEQTIPAARQRIKETADQGRTTFADWVAGLTPQAAAATAPQETPLLEMPLAEGEGGSTRIGQAGKQMGLPLSFTNQSGWQPGPDGRGALVLDGTVAQLPSVGDFEFDQPFTVTFLTRVRDGHPRATVISRSSSDPKSRGWSITCEQKEGVTLDLDHAGGDASLEVLAKRPLPVNQWVHVAICYDGSGKASGVRVYYDGQPVPTLVRRDNLAGQTIRTDAPFTVGGSADAIGFSGLSLWGLSLTSEEVVRLCLEPTIEALLKLPPTERAAQADGVFDWWLERFDQPFKEASARLAALEAERSEIVKRGTVAHVMQESADMPKAYVLDRGEYDKRKDEVGPETPDILPVFAESLPRNRLGLAQWLLLAEHPLTARVTVNRFWQEVFGTGLVRTSGDFGITGELPSHPELLDWLAVEFRESGWDVKRLFRLMVTSAAYRQAAVATPEKLATDAANRLLSRGPRYRMDAEMIRDQALAASGLLVRQIGGPSVKPYQPEGVWEAVAMNVSDTAIYKRDQGGNLYRRSMYWFWKRSAPPASLDIFNAPSRESCTVKRERTNTPLQALVTLNDPQFVEAARVLADRALREGGDMDEARIDFIARRLLARPLDAEETAIVKRSLADLAGWYAAHPDDAGKLVAIGDSKPTWDDAAVLAAWTMLANELLNLDEVLCK